MRSEVGGEGDLEGVEVDRRRRRRRRRRRASVHTRPRNDGNQETWLKINGGIMSLSLFLRLFHPFSRIHACSVFHLCLWLTTQRVGRNDADDMWTLSTYVKARKVTYQTRERELTPSFAPHQVPSCPSSSRRRGRPSNRKREMKKKKKKKKNDKNNINKTNKQTNMRERERDTRRETIAETTERFFFFHSVSFMFTNSNKPCLAH
ncbi:hypothetical protein IE53DRAFT_104862 [Violaceomyces palustris]|uniref:Uncharacterized protein n=1 Tax=Violaceomyces palustris TaxID=1673888 RepID=A0ACD0NWU9_9BASI|nr:hypothetical protein IE53DRAFT_104862 [Violaceomyces palustris]